MFVVTGVPGRTGSLGANTLLDAGKRVRVVVREAAQAEAFTSRGAEMAVADLADRAALETAFRGAEGGYLLVPPDMRANSFLTDKAKLVAGYADAIHAARVPHVVLLSAIGAQHDAGTGLIRSNGVAERVLSGAGAATTFVRAAYFVENWATVVAAAKQDGVLPSLSTGRRCHPDGFDDGHRHHVGQGDG